MLDEHIYQVRDTVIGELKALNDALHSTSNRQIVQETLLQQIEQMSVVEGPLRELVDRHCIQEQQIHDIGREIAHYQQPGGMLANQIRPMTGMLKQILQSHRAQDDVLRGIEQTVSKLDANGKLISVEAKHSPRSPQAFGSSSPFISETQSHVTSMKLIQSHCASACNCVCHVRSRFRSPIFLDAVLGSLFVGYQASPWAAQRCNNTECRQGSKKIIYTYAFPQWLLKHAILFNMAYSQPGGPELHLRLIRVRPKNAAIFSATRLFAYRQGIGVNHIKRLLDNGAASVLDVDTDGVNALQVNQLQLRVVPDIS